MAADESRDEDPSYSYKPSLAGAPVMLWLRPDGLEWVSGRRSGLLRYGRIRRIRLSYRPATMQTHRFVTDIWSSDAPKLQIASVSWQGLTMQQRQDAPYAAFVTELHRRLAAARSTAIFRCGVPAVLYGLGLVVVCGALLTFVMLMIKAAQIDEWRAVAVIGVVFVVSAWQLGGYFRYNRPGEYRPEDIPPYVLPRV